MPFDLTDLIVGLVPIVTGLMLWMGSRFSTKSSDVANRRGTEVDALKAANETLHDLIDPINEQLQVARATIKEMQASQVTNEDRLTVLEDSLEETQEVLDESMRMNLNLLQWIDDGAKPPPPTVTTERLRRRLAELKAQSHNPDTGRP